MGLTKDQVTRLLEGKSITDQEPWCTENDAVVNAFYQEVVDGICKSFSLRSRVVFDDYGSGYASFVEVWLYQDSDLFRLGPGNHFIGLVVLLSQLSPFFCPWRRPQILV